MNAPQPHRLTPAPANMSEEQPPLYEVDVSVSLMKAYLFESVPAYLKTVPPPSDRKKRATAIGFLKDSDTLWRLYLFWQLHLGWERWYIAEAARMSVGAPVKPGGNYLETLPAEEAVLMEKAVALQEQRVRRALTSLEDLGILESEEEKIPGRPGSPPRMMWFTPAEIAFYKPLMERRAR